MPALPIHECFYTWQGEGVHLGRAAYFIRTFGCPVKCPWCDSAGTWHPDYVPEDIERIEPGVLAERAMRHPAEFVVVTGGEPAIHDLFPLTRALKKRGMPAHLETSGGFNIRGDFSWVTVSPKWWKPPKPEILGQADEIKLIVEEETTIRKWWEIIEKWVGAVPVWLHPEWSKREDRAVLSSISNWVKEHGAPFRAGYQIHKPYQVDALDSSSRQPVPLGGNPELGF